MNFAPWQSGNQVNKKLRFTERPGQGKENLNRVSAECFNNGHCPNVPCREEAVVGRLYTKVFSSEMKV